MIKITLDSKYKALASQIRNTVIIEDKDLEKICRAGKENISELAYTWFDSYASSNIFKVIERIHSADEIEWVEPKYNWRLKSEKIYPRMWVNRYADGDLHFGSDEDEVERLTESEFKKLLEGTGLPFEAFEKVNVDE